MTLDVSRTPTTYTNPKGKPGMSNAETIKFKMAKIIEAIDDGTASPEKTIRACVKGVQLLASDIEAMEYREKSLDAARKSNPFGGLFG